MLYSGNASRPNAPLNICIGALIIKKFFSLLDDEVVKNLMLDPRYRYALNTTSFEEQPLSGKTLSRFRKRCYDYESAYGVELLHGCMNDLGGKIAKMMDINPSIRRMDSMLEKNGQFFRIKDRLRGEGVSPETSALMESRCFNF